MLLLTYAYLNIFYADATCALRERYVMRISESEKRVDFSDNYALNFSSGRMRMPCISKMIDLIGHYDKWTKFRPFNAAVRAELFLL